MQRSPLVELLQTPDRDALHALLAQNVRFHSPVTDYEGDDAAHVLSLIPRVMSEIEPTRTIVDSLARTTFISGRVGGQPVQGVLDEHYDERDLLVDVTLMLRPYATLRIAITEMGKLLDAPLPPRARSADQNDAAPSAR